MTSGIFELAFILVSVAILGILSRFLRQPLVLAYLATGTLIGYFGFFNLADKETFHIFSALGIMFLLFLIGLEINFTSLRLVGKTSVLVGLGQIAFTFLGGFIIASALGFDAIAASYIAIALTFSSTIIIVKLLSDKKEVNSLHGRISIGFLLVQDVVAILILILLAGLEAGTGASVGEFLWVVAKGALLFGAIVWLGRRFFPTLLDHVAYSQELLFLVVLAWVFGMAYLSDVMGLSIEIAGFLAGIALANSSEHFQIASRIKPLRDFFILIFFVILGSSLLISEIGGLAVPIAVFSAFVLIGNPLIVLVIMGLMGYKKRTSFMAGFTVAQISEFSLIIAAAGLRVGHITEPVVALITAVGVITITISTYLIFYSEKIYRSIKQYLVIFERRVTKEPEFEKEAAKKPIILIGFHRVGQRIAAHLRKEDLLVIDFDPEIIKRLQSAEYTYAFGDISDAEMFEWIDFESAHTVISTSPDLEDNLTLLSEIALLEKKPTVIVRAETDIDAEILYKKGARYVLTPYTHAGDYLGEMLAKGELAKAAKS